MPNYGKPFAGLCVATAIFLCGLTGYPLAPDVLPPESGTLSMDGASTGTVVSTGGIVTVYGSGFAPTAAVTISIHSTPRLLAQVVADDAGTISALVQLPPDLEAGEHTLAALGNGEAGGVWSLQAEITVVDATALPFTGASVVGWTIAAFGLILGGFALIRSVGFGRRLLPR